MRTREFDLDMAGMEFTRNWFRKRNLAAFREYVLPAWRDRPCLYLEIGVFEGMSACWMLQQVLTHSESRAVLVDPWLQTTKLAAAAMEQVRDRAWRNLAHRVGVDGKYGLRYWIERGNSAEVLRKMLGRHGYAGVRRGTVDVCMVDGDHNALGVLDDCRLVHDLLKPGGWMICDDVRNDRPKLAHVEDGLRMFLHEREQAGQPMELVWEWRYGECWRKASP